MKNTYTVISRRELLALLAMMDEVARPDQCDPMATTIILDGTLSENLQHMGASGAFQHNLYIPLRYRELSHLLDNAVVQYLKTPPCNRATVKQLASALARLRPRPR